MNRSVDLISSATLQPSEQQLFYTEYEKENRKIFISLIYLLLSGHISYKS